MPENENTKNSMTPLVVLGLLIILGILGFMFVSKSQNQQSLDTDTTNMEIDLDEIVDTDDVITEESNSATDSVENDSMDESTETTHEIEIEAGAFYYSPNVISVKKGDKVIVNITSVDMMHDFNVDALGVKSAIVKAGETGTVEFTADTVGTFEFYCSVGQHRANGQVGTLVVE